MRHFNGPDFYFFLLFMALFTFPSDHFFMYNTTQSQPDHEQNVDSSLQVECYENALKHDDSPIEDAALESDIEEIDESTSQEYEYDEVKEQSGGKDTWNEEMRNTERLSMSEYKSVEIWERQSNSWWKENFQKCTVKCLEKIVALEMDMNNVETVAILWDEVLQFHKNEMHSAQENTKSIKDIAQQLEEEMRNSGMEDEEDDYAVGTPSASARSLAIVAGAIMNGLNRGLQTPKMFLQVVSDHMRCMRHAIDEVLECIHASFTEKAGKGILLDVLARAVEVYAGSLQQATKVKNCVDACIQKDWCIEALVPALAALRELPLTQRQAQTITRKAISEILPKVSIENLPTAFENLLLISRKGSRVSTLKLFFQYVADVDKQIFRAANISAQSEAYLSWMQIKETLLLQIATAVRQDSQLGDILLELFIDQSLNVTVFSLIALLELANIHRFETRVLDAVFNAVFQTFHAAKRTRQCWLNTTLSDLEQRASSHSQVYQILFEMVESCDISAAIVRDILILSALRLVDCKLSVVELRTAATLHDQWCFVAFDEDMEALAEELPASALVVALGCTLINRIFQSHDQSRPNIMRNVVERVLENAAPALLGTPNSTVDNSKHVDYWSNDVAVTLQPSVMLLNRFLRDVSRVSVTESSSDYTQSIMQLMEYISYVNEQDARSIVHSFLLHAKIVDNPALMNSVIKTLKKQMFSPEISSSIIGVYGLLSAVQVFSNTIEDLPVDVCSSQYQRSQPASSVFNAEDTISLCSELLQTLKRAFQQAEVCRRSLLIGLPQCLNENTFKPIAQLMRPHFFKFYRRKGFVPFDVSLCLPNNSGVYEPLPHMMYAVGALIHFYHNSKFNGMLAEMDTFEKNFVGMINTLSSLEVDELGASVKLSEVELSALYEIVDGCSMVAFDWVVKRTLRNPHALPDDEDALVMKKLVAVHCKCHARLTKQNDTDVQGKGKVKSRKKRRISNETDAANDEPLCHLDADDEQLNNKASKSHLHVTMPSYKRRYEAMITADVIIQLLYKLAPQQLDLHATLQPDTSKKQKKYLKDLASSDDFMEFIFRAFRTVNDRALRVVALAHHIVQVGGASCLLSLRQHQHHYLSKIINADDTDVPIALESLNAIYGHMKVLRACGPHILSKYCWIVLKGGSGKDEPSWGGLHSMLREYRSVLGSLKNAPIESNAVLKIINFLAEVVVTTLPIDPDERQLKAFSRLRAFSKQQLAEDPENTTQALASVRLALTVADSADELGLLADMVNAYKAVFDIDDRAEDQPGCEEQDRNSDENSNNILISSPSTTDFKIMTVNTYMAIRVELIRKLDAVINEVGLALSKAENLFKAVPVHEGREPSSYIKLVHQRAAKRLHEVMNILLVFVECAGIRGKIKNSANSIIRLTTAYYKVLLLLARSIQAHHTLPADFKKLVRELQQRLDPAIIQMHKRRQEEEMGQAKVTIKSTGAAAASLQAAIVKCKAVLTRVAKSMNVELDVGGMPASTGFKVSKLRVKQEFSHVSGSSKKGARTLIALETGSEL